MKKIYKVEKAWAYDYKIIVTEYKNDILQIRVINDLFDKSDYAFVKKNNLTLDGLYSYSEIAVNFVKQACIAANLFERLNKEEI